VRGPLTTRLVALAILLAAAAGALWSFGLGVLMIVIGAQRPDPSVPDGDPCCGHPDTWAQVVELVGYGALWVIASLGLLAVVAAAAVGVVEARAPRWIRSRWARRFAVVWGVATLAAAGLLLTG
jgi:hypothetical protein